jgi:prepilin-type N-terminal cleavage/methylation domain-containing protein/prepilin-type processing-associated H-X9-DG protein
MNTTHRPGCLFRKSSRLQRQGFSLLELLVVISILALLMSLILPAVASARQTARRVQCLNSVRNLGIGLINFSSQSPKSQLPAYGTWGDYRSDSTHQWVNNANPAQLKNWVVDILPHIDRVDLSDRWQPDRKHDSTFVKDRSSNLSIIRGMNMEVLTCPDDQTASGVHGALSYVVNAGYASISLSLTNASGWGAARQQADDKLRFDWDKNGRTAVSSTPDANDIEINYRSGLFWPETMNRQGAPKPDPVRNRSHSFHTIQDGTGNTLMLTENVNAAGSQHWGDPDPRFATFVFPVDYVGAGFTSSTYYVAAPLDRTHPYGVINGARGGPEGARPFPNANHPGGVNIVMCDGSARFLSDDLDLNIYAQLITPSGTRASPTIRPQDPLSGNSF